jgi:hypothetical protein
MTEFKTTAELFAHYAGVKARLNAGPPVALPDVPAAPPTPTRPQKPIPFDFLAPPHWRQLVKLVMLRTGVGWAEIMAPGRSDQREAVSFARGLAIALVKTHVGGSLAETGRRFGRDHTTVLHCLRLYQAGAYAMGPDGRPRASRRTREGRSGALRDGDGRFLPTAAAAAEVRA